MTVKDLKNLGYDVQDIRGSSNEGLLDTEIWKMAQKTESLLITTDKGFAQHREQHHWGILIVRLRQPNHHRIHKMVMLALKHFSEEKWRGMIVTMRDRTMNVILART